MNVYFYKNFKKRTNSTKQPAANSHDRIIDCQLKENCSIENPILRITTGSATAGWQDTLNYAYIPSWGRYYKVQDAVYSGGNIWEIHLQDDVLASNKANILNTTAFIEYAGDANLPYLPDLRLNMQGNRLSTGYDSASILANVEATWYYVTVISSKGAAITYEMRADAYNTFAQNFTNLSPTDKQTLELQCGNAFAAIRSVKLIPFQLSSVYAPAHRIDTTEVDCAGLIIGTGGVTISYWLTEPYDSPLPLPGGNAATYMYENSIDLNIPWYPGVDDFRNLEPYSYFTLFMPLYGQIIIDPSRLIGQTKLNIDYVISVRDGILTYKVTAGNDTIGIYDAKCSMEVAIGSTLANAAGTMSSLTSGLGAMVGALASGNPIGAFQTGLGMANNIGLSSYQRTISTNGSSSGLTMFKYGKSVVLRRYSYNIVGSPSDYKSILGAPLMKAESLSAHSGYYVKCNNASVEISHYSGETETINNYLNSGVYLE